MNTVISDSVVSLLPPRRKTTPSGWTSFDAPCCVHNGESQDKRGRGGIITQGDGSVSYHCFNCNFKIPKVSFKEIFDPIFTALVEKIDTMSFVD